MSYLLKLLVIGSFEMLFSMFSQTLRKNPPMEASNNVNANLYRAPVSKCGCIVNGIEVIPNWIDLLKVCHVALLHFLHEYRDT